MPAEDEPVTQEQLASLSRAIDDARIRLTALETTSVQRGTGALRDTRDEQRAERYLLSSIATAIFIGLAMLVSVIALLLDVFRK